MKKFLILVLLSLLSWEARADTIQSASILNSYGSVVPSGLINVNPQSGNAQLMDTRNGGAAQVSNAQLQFLCSFPTDFRDECTGKSGTTKIIVVASKVFSESGRASSTYRPFKNDEQPNFSRVIGTATVFPRPGHENSVDLSTLRSDFQAYLLRSSTNCLYRSRADFIATSYGARTSGEGTAITSAFSSVLSGITAGIAGGITGNSSSATILPSVSITFLLFKNE